MEEIETICKYLSKMPVLAKWINSDRGNEFQTLIDTNDTNKYCMHVSFVDYIFLDFISFAFEAFLPIDSLEFGLL